MNRRRFVNLVVQNWKTQLYSLHRINPCKDLFYESIKEAEAAADNKKTKKFRTLRRLPDPIVSFDPSPTGVLFSGLEWFELFAPRNSEGRIINSNKAGETAMFDVDKHVLLTLPSLYQPKGLNPVALSVTHPGTDEDSLYLMDRYPGRAVTRPRFPPGPCQPPRSCFEVLEYAPMVSETDDRDKGWRWRLLPPPPFVHLPGYKPTLITSYTTLANVDGCTSICISSDNGFGTYCFDTARLDPSHRLGWTHSQEWRYVGDWALPFEGRAEYIREFNLWFGFNAPRPYHLCAVDLSTMDHGRPPTMQHVWEDLSLPEEGEWFPLHLRLLNLGDGRFCIAKVFDDVETGKQFAVLTGVEMVRNKQDQSLRVVRHKRTRYMSTSDMVRWVL